MSPDPILGEIVIDEGSEVRMRSLEALAIRIAQIGYPGLYENRDEVRAIGQDLHTAGGKALMVTVLRRADAICLASAEPSIAGPLESEWDGIGDWQC